MQKYFKAYRYDLKTLKKIYDKLEKSGFDDFNKFTSTYPEICWLIEDNKLIAFAYNGWCITNLYKEVDEDFVTKILGEDKMPTIISANEARKILNENINSQIELILADINTSIKEAIKRLENSVNTEFSNKFSNIVNILEDAGYLLMSKDSEDFESTIVEISW